MRATPLTIPVAVVEASGDCVATQQSEFDMQRWQDELIKHPLNTTVKQFIDAIENDAKAADPAIEAERARFSKVIYLLRDTISDLDPDIAPFDLLDQIQSQLNSHGVLQAVQSVASGREVEIYRDLNTRLTPILSYIAQLRASSIKTGISNADSRAATEAFERFAIDIESKRQLFEVWISETFLQVNKIKDKVDTLEIEAKSALDAITANINNLNNEATTTQVNQKAAFTAMLNKSVSDFSTSVAKIIDGASKELRDFLHLQDEEAKNQRQSVEITLDSIIKDSHEKHKKILDLYELVAVDSVSGGHKTIAVREQTAAQNWRRATVLSIGVIAAWLLYSLFGMKPELGSDRAFWLQVGKSVSLTALLISFAVYASKQAALHRANERRARAFFLQVQAFDPFIKDLEPADKLELKKALSARIFAPEDIQQDQAVLENGALDAVDRVMGFMERLSKLKAR